MIDFDSNSYQTTSEELTKAEGMDEMDKKIVDEVFFDMFPNVKKDFELEEEMGCWDRD